MIEDDVVRSGLSAPPIRGKVSDGMSPPSKAAALYWLLEPRVYARAANLDLARKIVIYNGYEVEATRVREKR
ncbi:unnamed protein product [Angiostrongylus costaricensis]|uniref:Transposase n=1 Tax=Angiostrongylus costaricensis TaxID=334426 RepID=A0A0R3PFS6_ANGCS|nr:unnamed protein product [Angiostrongylus costaricensis]